MQLLAVLALGALVAAVLFPVLRQRTGASKAGDAGAPDPRASDLEEIELDRQMGKLSEDDYRALRRGIERAGAQAKQTADGTPTAAPLAEAPDVPVAHATASSRASHSAPRAGSDPPPFPARSAQPSATAASAVPTALDDLAEQLVRQYREKQSTCPTCGVRPEPDARYCSNCGRVLQPCRGCGHVVEEPGTRFCPRCGTALGD